jgi:hypothetical protein
MAHNLIERYERYLQLVEKLDQLQVEFKMKPTLAREEQIASQSNVLTNVHLSLMAALRDRTKLHARSYKLQHLVTRFRKCQFQRKHIFHLRTRLIEEPRNETVKTKLRESLEENNEMERELMADAVQALDPILEVQSRNE